MMLEATIQEFASVYTVCRVTTGHSFFAFSHFKLHLGNGTHLSSGVDHGCAYLISSKILSCDKFIQFRQIGG